ncbi:hypothetical protein H6G89_07290 [Oscillatoria sp. FACHB-1407]|nr:hypothetical protein [Oscillatoria sp. FACHB-1407]MBD2460846.1 hypothetical protein [Oscillatoria sp. FACHB-1407]
MAGFDEPTQVGFALIAAVLTAEILTRIHIRLGLTDSNPWAGGQRF